MQICSKKNIIDAKHLKHTTEIREIGLIIGLNCNLDIKY